MYSTGKLDISDPQEERAGERSDTLCRMLPLLLLSQIAAFIAAAVAECDLSKAAIVDGTYTVSDGGNIGSVVKYSCPKGMYPHPGYSRECLLDGRWKKENIKAVCKAIQCPTPAMFEGGELFPRRRKYFVGDVLNLECWDGFKMFGPGNHTCLENGKWSGKLTICDHQEGECRNPGIPFGAVKIGISYNIENSVTYECQYGMKITGSSKRQCMENKRWSGAEPSCREWYIYDTPKEVASSISSSLSETIESSDPDKEDGTVDRKVHISEGGLMNIFILMDASKSVGKENFETAKESSETFIDKISSFDFEPRYAVISYASLAKPIVRLSEEESVNPDQVIEKIKKFKYREHEDKQGTNTRAALAEVHGMLSLQKLRDPEKFKKIRNVILLMTDGKYNMGGDPTVEIRRMRDLLNITKDREEYFDVYVFGLGDDVSITELNDIASKKDQEKHVFLMRDVDDMKEAFEDIIDETEAFQMCGLSKEKVIIGGDLVEMFPWIAKISITRPESQEKCKGSIVSKNFILTAAHCFYIDEEMHYITVDIGGGQGQKVKTLYHHPKYNPAGKSDKNVKKSFDYDLALLELEKPIQFSQKSRPVCLPCTNSTSWALKQRGKSVTCSDHRNILLLEELVKAMFIAEEKPRNLEQKNVLIKQGRKRDACLADAKKVKEFENVTDITDAVTDNFLCTGGIEPEVDPQTCKGDSGGPLIVAFKKRYIQVGVVSWGNVNSCIGSIRRPGPVPAESRDFHTDVIRMMDWIHEVMKDDLEFL
ncbi:complement factor B-like [Pseudophryne corroboree]|uniref:complement factor B-like n=1 Tax=Pseudophryne corroboree TaxID=495146 RepID=UPI00308181DB